MKYYRPADLNHLPASRHDPGIAIPKMHTTWYATKLQLIDVADKDFTLRRKGKICRMISRAAENIMKDWGDYGKKMQWQMLCSVGLRYNV